MFYTMRNTLSLLSVLIFDLSYVMCLNTYISNSTYWRSLSNFIPSTNTSYGNITLHRVLEMQFNFIYYNKTYNKYNNVFRIGYPGPNRCDSAGTRYPAMWINPTKQQFQITISDNVKCFDNTSPWIALQSFVQYHMFIKFNQTWQYASIYNGTATHVFINEAREAPTANTLYTIMKVWFSSEHEFAPNITLSDIIIQTWDPITPQPTSNPTLSPTISPTNNPTISTIIPSINPSLHPTATPSFIPTYNPTISPTYNPTIQPTETPTISPSTNPTIEPSIEPTDLPTATQINALSPTNNPLYEQHISETQSFTTSDVIIDKQTHENNNHLSWINKLTLIIPIIVCFICVLCCFIIYFWKRYDIRINKSLTPRSQSNNNNHHVEILSNGNDNEEDIIFGKIYNKQIELNIQEQKLQNNSDNMEYGVHNDVLLPNEDSLDSLSSNAAEQMYIPQTHPSTITASQATPIVMRKSDDFNISIPVQDNYNSKNLQAIKCKKSYSFNSKKFRQNKSKSQSRSVHSHSHHELELQHQINEIDDKKIINDIDGEGFHNNNNMNNNTIVSMQDEHGSDSEEDDDLDIYNVDIAAPSSGNGNMNMKNDVNNKKRNNYNQLISQSATPEMELYGKGKIYSNNNNNNNDVKSDDSIDELYIKPSSNNNYLQTPTKRTRNDSQMAKLYEEPSFMDRENTEGANDYEWIQQSLQMCDPIDWKKYLDNFKMNKVCDVRLNQLNDNDLKELIPNIGPRNDFKQLWFQYQLLRKKSMHL